MTDDQILELVVDLAPGEEYTDPEDGVRCFNTLGFARKFAAAVRREAFEEAAQVCDQLWTRAGDADQCADAIRALARESGD